MNDHLEDKPEDTGSAQAEAGFYPTLDRFSAFSDGVFAIAITLLALEDFQNAGRAADTLISAATWTILLSVMLHGLTAAPLSSWCARRLAAAPSPPVLLTGVSPLRQRRRALTHAEQ